MSEETAVEVQAEDLLYPDSYTLTAVDLYNWGPFGGRHRIDFDRTGSCIVGGTGSGKTTIIDAIMTLIAERPQYNLASTGGVPDRDLVSYVRGHKGQGNGIDYEHISRQGPTRTAIGVELSRCEEIVRLMAIFWFEGQSSSQADLLRAWIFDPDNRTDFNTLVQLSADGGLRDLKALAKETPNLRVSKEKKKYMAAINHLFQVGYKAFALLNKAAGLKQINDIDDLFRNLVLEDESTFDRARDVVNGFDTLTTIHKELETAREQRDRLLPIKGQNEALYSAEVQRDKTSVAIGILAKWFGEHRHQLLIKEIAESRKQLETADAEKKTQSIVQGNAKREEEDAHRIFIESGGGDIADIEEEITKLKQAREKKESNLAQYKQIAEKFGLETEINVESFGANRAEIPEKTKELETEKAQHSTPLDEAITDATNIKRIISELEESLEAARNRLSNLPDRQHAIRSILCKALELEESDLPFLAELVEVKSEERAWRGAIERAIGTRRLNILVPEEYMGRALRYINDRDNGQDVRLRQVKEDVKPARFREDSYLFKLNFKKHAYRETVKSVLAEYDRRCVDTPEALKHINYGLTREGLMSGRQGYFEKLDSTRLDQNWMTGFNSNDRIQELSQYIEAEKEKLVAASKSRTELNQIMSELDQRSLMLSAFDNIEYHDIDFSIEDKQITDCLALIDLMSSESSQLNDAKSRWDLARENYKRQLEKYEESVRVQDRCVNALSSLEDERERAISIIGEGISNDQRELMSEVVPIREVLDSETLKVMEDSTREKLREDHSKLVERIGDFEKKLVSLMNRAKQVDNGPLAEVGVDIPDIPSYLERLQILEDEDLPAKEARFLEYLRETTDQSVTQLITSIENSVETIIERIDELNSLMRGVDYKEGQYLQLRPQRKTGDQFRELRSALRKLNTARLATEEDKGEAHYNALFKVVEIIRGAVDNPKRVASLALLDPRHQLEFRGTVVRSSDDHVVDTFRGSQGGSGGEKETIASYILIASLSYALCPEGVRRPIFGSFFLDEAFSKTSHQVAEGIVTALRQFGLSPLFITPNKEMSLLRKNSNSAVVIFNKNKQSRAATLTWEQIDRKIAEARLSGLKKQ